MYVLSMTEFMYKNFQVAIGTVLQVSSDGQVTCNYNVCLLGWVRNPQSAQSLNKLWSLCKSILQCRTSTRCICISSNSVPGKIYDLI